MKIVVFGLTISSSWGNGHATVWRALVGALARAGHQVTFFERDVAYYAAHRDLHEIPGGELCLYGAWDDVRSAARTAIALADVAIVTSYCPDAVAASDLVVGSRAPRKVFYDLDTGVTLDRRRKGHAVEYVPPYGLESFDLVLSFTGGLALDGLRAVLGARQVAPLYGSVDPEVHRPVDHDERYRADLSYLGTYAEDRQHLVERLFLEPAQQLAGHRFRIGGSQYPESFPWRENVWYSAHVPPPDHPAFYSSSRLTLNVTRAAMAAYGYCPSGRLFEAAACGVPIVSDAFDGLYSFFRNDEIIVADDASDVVAALQRSPDELSRMAGRARERVLAEHTGDVRARELIRLIEEA